MLRRLLVPALLWSCVGGCRSAGTPARPVTGATALETRATPPSIRPLGDVRSRVVTSVTVAPIPRAIRQADELGKALRLPLSLGEQLMNGLAQAGASAGFALGPDEVALLSNDVPVAWARVAGEEKGMHDCLAVTFRDPAAARRALSTLGSTTPRPDGYVGVTTRAGAAFTVGVDGARLVVGDTPESLFQSCAAAIEATARRPAAIVEATGFVEAIAKANDVELAALPAAAEASIQAELAKTAREKKGADDLPPGMRGLVAAALAAVVRLGTEARAATASLDLGVSDGLVVRLALDPRPGTPLAASAAADTSFAIDPLLPIADDAPGVFAWAPMPRAMQIFREAMEGGGASTKPLRTATDAYAATVTGAASCTFVPRAGASENTCVWPLAPGVSGATALARYADFMRAICLWTTKAIGAKPPRIAVKRTADAVRVDVKVSAAGLSPPLADALRQSFGARGVWSTGAAVRGDRLVVWQSPEGTPPPASQATGPGYRPAPTSAVATALARARDQEAVLYMDLMALMRASLANNPDPRVKQAMAMLKAIPGTDKLALPTAMTLRKGAAPTLEMQLPYATLSGLTEVMRPFFGMMGPGAKK